MKKPLILLLAWMLLMPALRAQRTFEVHQPDFDTYFRDQTLTFYYYRQGNAHSDTILLAPSPFVLHSNLAWSGSLTQLLDPINNGDYRILMCDQATGREIYSRTYNNLFREYRDTPTGTDSIARFEEALRLPMPKNPVLIHLQKRDSLQQFRTQQTFPYNPRRPQKARGINEPIPLSVTGDPHVKIDVAIIAEGYGPADTAKMRADFFRFTEYLFGQEPFRSRRNDFNVWGVPVTGTATGITDPTRNLYVESAVGSTYNTFGNDRYLMTFNLFLLHSHLAATPCDHIIIMANSDTYGGGAIYNFYAISSLNPMASHILPHELGHSIGGLADEYVDESLSYNELHRPGQEPLEPNVTSLVDFEHKWKDMIAPSTPQPTPPCTLAHPMDNCGPLGLYEGAAYHTHGFYRPVMNCMMNYYAPFCPVCTRALNIMFDLYTK